MDENRFQQPNKKPDWGIQIVLSLVQLISLGQIDDLMEGITNLQASISK